MINTGLNWLNLKTLNCPKCESDLDKANEKGFKCTDEKCTFFITTPKIKEMVNKMFDHNNDELGRAEFEALLETFE